MFKVLGFVLASVLCVTAQAKDCDKGKSCPLKECAKLVLQDQKDIMSFIKGTEEAMPMLVLRLDKTDFECFGANVAKVTRHFSVVVPLKVEPLIFQAPLEVTKPLCEKFTLQYTIIPDPKSTTGEVEYKDAPKTNLVSLGLCTGDE